MKHSTDRSIGERAYSIALSLNLPLTELAAQLGIDRKTIYAWKRGDPPSVYALQALALHGWDIHYILTGDKGENRVKPMAQTTIIKNPNCKKCIYRSNRPFYNSCDYMYLTSKMRGCPVEECDKFEKGPRLKHPLPAVSPKATQADAVMAGYVAGTKNRLCSLADVEPTYSTKL